MGLEVKYLPPPYASESKEAEGDDSQAFNTSKLRYYVNARWAHVPAVEVQAVR
ncbi:MAG: hypothetical protein QXT64_02445 [Desulfurococcaceae archaeon]